MEVLRGHLGQRVPETVSPSELACMGLAVDLEEKKESREEEKIIFSVSLPQPATNPTVHRRSPEHRIS